MTLLQTLAKLWARWFCKWHRITPVNFLTYCEIYTQKNNGWKMICPGFKCKGCPLKESK